MGKYSRLLNEYYEATGYQEDDGVDDCPKIFTKIYPKEIRVKTDEEGFPFIEYCGYCGTTRGLKSIYIPRIDMEIENFYCDKETATKYSFEPDFEMDEDESEDGADSYLSTISFTPDFCEAAPDISCEITKWFYGFSFTADKFKPFNDSTMFFSLMELTADDIKELGLEEGV